MTRKEDGIYDVVIVGSGPGGLQTAIGTSSEGLRTLVIDKAQRLGGQAGESTEIKNLIGFPHGVTGKELTAAGVLQAQHFGTEFRAPFEAQRIHQNGDELFRLIGEDREEVIARTIVLAVGAQYRRLDAINLSVYIDRGVYYGSPVLEPDRWKGKTVGVVGGANSAAQAAWYLANTCGCHVNMFVRGPSIEEEMSDYIYRCICASENIDVHTSTIVTEAYGDAGMFKGVKIRPKEGGDENPVPLDYLFVLIGARPHTAWLDDHVAMDERGFIYTDRDLPDGAWQLSRKPFAHETSRAGLFALGDAEWGSTKRMSAAIGGGASVVPGIHQYLTELKKRQLAAKAA